MGMYDTVLCQRVLPDGFDGTKKGVDFQTKSLDKLLDLYKITDRGRLVKLRDHDELDMNHHGDIRFYTYILGTGAWHEYVARFTYGNLESIIIASKQEDH